VERNRKASQNPPRVVAPVEEEEAEEEEEEGPIQSPVQWVPGISRW
jgi:hypothetical protein